MNRTFFGLLTIAFMGCGEDVTLPTVEVRSPHFRYFATSADRIPVGVLDRLERHRAEMLSYLGMSSERVIRYYRFDSAQDFNRLDRCKGALGCTQGDESNRAQLPQGRPHDLHSLRPLRAASRRKSA